TNVSLGDTAGGGPLAPSSHARGGTISPRAPPLLPPPPCAKPRPTPPTGDAHLHPHDALREARHHAAEWERHRLTALPGRIVEDLGGGVIGTDVVHVDGARRHRGLPRPGHEVFRLEAGGRRWRPGPDDGLLLQVRRTRHRGWVGGAQPRRGGRTSRRGAAGGRRAP